MNYMFIGASDKYFDAKLSGKVKKLVFHLFDYEFAMQAEYNPLTVNIKPNTGFTTAVAKAILQYRKEHPDKIVRVGLYTEFSTDFAELPDVTQSLFRELRENDGGDSFYVNSLINVAVHGKSGSKAAYSGVVAGAPIYYLAPDAKVDKVFEKELKYIEEVSPSDRINFWDNLNGLSYEGSYVRKRSTSVTYSYRIALKLPNGESFRDEKAGFVTRHHAKQARDKVLMEKMLQTVVDCDLTFSLVAKEYIETQKNKKALYVKYMQYYNSFLQLQNTGSLHITQYAKEDRVPTGILRGFEVNHAVDGRRSDDYYTGANGLSEGYIQGYYAFLNNVFDYAYNQKYIAYQPLYFVELRKSF